MPPNTSEVLRPIWPILNEPQQRLEKIRGSQVISPFHELVKTYALNQGISPERIVPKLGEPSQRHYEITLYGAWKGKGQDVCILPQGVRPSPTPMSRFGYGQTDPYGYEYTSQTTVVVIRGQFTSICKNTSVTIERALQESANLHERCPEMVLGLVYPIAVYDNSICKKTGAIKFKRTTRFLEAILMGCHDLSNRKPGDQFNRYERVCVIPIDFEKQLIYTSTDELKQDGLIPASSPASLDSISLNGFMEDILRIREERFGYC